jgi:hypothetical protein
MRSRYPDPVTGHGVGHGPRRCGSLGSPMHRPAVTFGARRASAPARRPAWWLSRTSPAGHTWGSPTRYCAHRNSNAGGTIPCTARPPWRDLSCPAGHVILVLCRAREGEQQGRGASGARGCGAWRPPVASRPDALRNVFSGAWHPPRAFRRTSGIGSGSGGGSSSGSARYLLRSDRTHNRKTPAVFRRR